VRSEAFQGSAHKYGVRIPVPTTRYRILGQKEHPQRAIAARLLWTPFAVNRDNIERDNSEKIDGAQRPDPSSASIVCFWQGRGRQCCTIGNG
jgi:hypothetical protein